MAAYNFSAVDTGTRAVAYILLSHVHNVSSKTSVLRGTAFTLNLIPFAVGALTHDATAHFPSSLHYSAGVLQSSMTASLQKKSGTNYGPTGSAKMIFFVDDLNLPALDVYNTQSAMALIRQHMDYGHW